ncbi:hypothetical protein D3C76_1067380 [compost metagenome]
MEGPHHVSRHIQAFLLEQLRLFYHPATVVVQIALHTRFVGFFTPQVGTRRRLDESAQMQRRAAGPGQGTGPAHRCGGVQIRFDDQ